MTLRSEIKADISKATVQILSTISGQIAKLSSATSQRDTLFMDNMHEIVSRTRFLTDRMQAVEVALGIGYINDAGLKYDDHVTKNFPLKVAVATGGLPVVGTSGVTGSLAQTNDRVTH